MTAILAKETRTKEIVPSWAGGARDCDQGQEQFRRERERERLWLHSCICVSATKLACELRFGKEKSAERLCFLRVKALNHTVRGPKSQMQP